MQANLHDVILTINVHTDALTTDGTCVQLVPWERGSCLLVQCDVSGVWWLWAGEWTTTRSPTLHCCVVRTSPLSSSCITTTTSQYTVEWVGSSQRVVTDYSCLFREAVGTMYQVDTCKYEVLHANHNQLRCTDVRTGIRRTFSYHQQQKRSYLR